MIPSTPLFARSTLLSLAALWVGACPACAAETVPTEAPGIVGQITFADAAGVRVEEKPGERGGSSKAMVRITADTRLIGLDGERMPAGSLRVGQRVRVWFRGPVAESYPVQGTGAVIQLVP